VISSTSEEYVASMIKIEAILILKTLKMEVVMFLLNSDIHLQDFKESQDGKPTI
jgi:hypothetical protein